MIRRSELAHSVLEMIKTGEYGVGGKLPTSREIVRRFNASMATVSKSMKELIRMGVIEARPGSGYYVKSSAVPVSIQKNGKPGSLVIALLPAMRNLSPSEGQYYYNLVEVLQGATAECVEKGLVLSHHYFEKLEEFPVVFKDILSRSDLFGICEPSFLFSDHYKCISDHGIAFTHLGTPDKQLFDCVNDSYAAAARMAVEHLANTGRRGILFVGKGNDHPHEREKLDTISKARREFGLPDGREWNLFSEDIMETAGKRIMKLRNEGLNFDAVICVNDHTALNVLKAFEHGNVSVPKDVAVIGSDDMPGVERLSPPLSTIRREREEMGCWLIRLLVERVRSPKASLKTIVVNDTFILRKSAG